jgi:alkylation response protein AidB-like acyl-CoA dehydrogenase
MAKYYASVVAQEASGNAIEWAGGVGFTRETGIEKFWRDSKIVSLLYLSTAHETYADTGFQGCNLRRN